MQVGDIIVRKSYQKDMKFTIVKIINHQAILNGLNYRLIADADLDDLECVESRLLISNKWSKLSSPAYPISLLRLKHHIPMRVRRNQ